MTPYGLDELATSCLWVLSVKTAHSHSQRAKTVLSGISSHGNQTHKEKAEDTL